MRYARLIGGLLILASVATGWAEQSFDEKYERDYNLFNSITRDQPDNPLNPTNAYSPTTLFILRTNMIRTTPRTPSTNSIPTIRSTTPSSAIAPRIP